jgi:hypothetical protein
VDVVQLLPYLSCAINVEVVVSALPESPQSSERFWKGQRQLPADPASPASAHGARHPLLDFRRLPTEDEKRGIRERPQVSEELFPAAEALELIGKEALPEVLRAIKADSTSATTRDNAVAVWMEAYKYERPKGVALLKQEETKANDDTTKQKLRWAVQKALTYCSPPVEEEGAACRQAAADSSHMNERCCSKVTVGALALKS